MNKLNDLGLIIMSVILGIGIIIGGYFIYKGLKSFSDKDRIVTVKGLAEKEIDAVEAYIRINTSFSGDLPKELITKTDKRIEDIKKYLNQRGIDQKDIKISDITIYDSKEYYRYDYQLKQK
ncbi:MAG: SIMPL domain-containing protein, partial [Bacteroidales bacterium]|nr:SIMPL domain-containing protein [Bacteroidales bacterium]MDD3725101.1 SIMPL domain-containing protein [Bacteroidales bacterium]